LRGREKGQKIGNGSEVCEKESIRLSGLMAHTVGTASEHVPLRGIQRRGERIRGEE